MTARLLKKMPTGFRNLFIFFVSVFSPSTEGVVKWKAGGRALINYAKGKSAKTRLQTSLANGRAGFGGRHSSSCSFPERNAQTSFRKENLLVFSYQPFITPPHTPFHYKAPPLTLGLPDCRFRNVANSGKKWC